MTTRDTPGYAGHLKISSNYTVICWESISLFCIRMSVGLSVNDGNVSDSSKEVFTVTIEDGPISICSLTSSLYSIMSLK